MTNYNKNNLAVVVAASKNGTKPELKSVAFYEDRTVATDSFRLIEMSVPFSNYDPAKHLDDPVIINRANIDRVKLKKDDTIALDDLRSGTVEGTYPKYTELFDAADKRDSIEFKINAHYLADVLKLLGNLSDFHAVTVRVPKDSATYPITVLAVNKKKGQAARALVMPMLK